MYDFGNDEMNNKFKVAMREYEQYRMFLNETVDFSNPHTLIERLEKINAFNASIPTLKSKMDYFLEKAKAESMRKIDHEAMPAKKYDAMVAAEVSGINIFCKALEMLLKESHYQIESIRSVLSYYKTEKISGL